MTETNSIHSDIQNGAGMSGKGSPTSMESKQLLYSEKFGQCYQEKQLNIVGKYKAESKDHLGKRKTFNVPQSSVLSQIKGFLPELSRANDSTARMLEEQPELINTFNIECVNDEKDEEVESIKDSDKGEHIEMNLSLVPSDLLKNEFTESSESDNEDFHGSMPPAGVLDFMNAETETGSSANDDTVTVFSDLQLPTVASKDRNRKPYIQEMNEDDELAKDSTNR